MNKEEIIKALAELRKNEKKKFSQGVDLIINLKNFDIKRESINLIVSVPHKFKKIKAAAFLVNKNNAIDTITKPEFDLYKGKKAKHLVKAYDFFMAHASLMPSIASTFGKFLGPAGKMPSPQLGIIVKDDENTIKETIKKAESSVKIKSKEPSLKMLIGKEDMKDEEIADNILVAYNAVLNALAKKKEQIRSTLIKFTMTKPIKLQI
jgi:large subunit ribosomal protein L1